MRFARTAIGAGLALALATAPAALAADYPPPSDAQGTVSPSRIQAGECAVFSGGAFAPGTEVDVTDDKEPRGRAPVEDNGTFHKQLCYPADTPPGKHVLKGTGDAESSHGKRTVTATLTIEGVSQSKPSHANANANANAHGNQPLAQDDTALAGYTSPTAAPALAAATGGLLLLGLGSGYLLLAERRHRRRRLA